MGREGRATPGTARPAILFLSNGHGEDVIGAQIAQRVHALAGTNLQLNAFPLVGLGKAYRRAGIPVVGPQAQLPSGGLAYLRLGNLAADLLAGGLGLFFRQLGFVRRHRQQWDAVVGVGDRVSLLLNHHILKKPMVWVALADTIRVVPPGKRFGSPRLWQPLRHPDVDAFVRDSDTQAALEKMGYPSKYVGNPMRDGVIPNPEVVRRVHAALRVTGWNGADPVVALLPGSRSEALGNLVSQLEAVRHLHRMTDGRIHAVVAWAAGASAHVLTSSLAEAGWVVRSGQHDGWVPQAGESLVFPARPVRTGPVVPLLRGAFPEIVEACTAVIGQTGTAVEQAAGVGKPVVMFESGGMVLTRRTLRRYQRLLRDAIQVSDPDPEAVAQELLAILSDPERYRSMSEAGKKLMGPPGATEAIARRIVQRFS